MKLTLLACLLFTTLIYGQCPPGDVTLSTQADVDNFIATYPTCDTISGYLYINGSVNDLSALDYILYIDAALNINNTSLTTISNFNSLLEAPVGIQITNNTMLTEISDFNGLNITMQIYIQNNVNLLSIDGFNNLPSVDIDFWIATNPLLQTVSGFSSLTNISDFFGINDCPLLSSIPSFNNLNFVGRGIQFFNTGLTDISGFDNLTTIGDFDPVDGLNFSNNQNLVSVSGFNCLETIVFDVLIQDNPLLDNISGLCSLQSVGQFFTIRNNNSLTTLNGLQSLVSLSTSAYDGFVTLDINNNPQLSNCDALCNLLSSGGHIGLANITNNQTGCDTESQINTTGCVPFNVLDCTNLISPIDGATGIAIDTDISWNPIMDATSYLISIGTTSQGTQIANNLNVGNVTTYNLPINLPANTEIFVKVKPFNTSGNAKCCDEERFTTINATTLDCTTLSAPLNGDTNVLLTSALSWNAITQATGYLLSIGTVSGGTDILNSLDVGNVATYNPTSNFPENTQLFVTIIPYNTSGQAMGCLEESFTTIDSMALGCTTLSSPINGDTNVLLTSELSWNSITEATGYFISIGTASGGTDILNSFDVGNVTTYNPIINFPENIQLFVTIIPYNTSEQAVGCTLESFTTQTLATIPNCTSLLNPINGDVNVSITTNISWNVATNATGYFLSIATIPGGADLINNLDVGAEIAFNSPIDLPEDSVIYVTIIPYNSSGQALACFEEHFTTKKNITITIPKYFTPNFDGFHDVWKIEDPDNLISTTYIFDRFGKLLKTKRNSPLAWDGIFNNQVLPVNDYWYIIELYSGERISGHFTLKL